MKWIIYTDLDGTLLDFNSYSYEVTQSTVDQLHAMDIPVIFCSSKTRIEQEFYRRAMLLEVPFIVENGSAIFIPDGYFKFELETLKIKQGIRVTQIENYAAIVLGKDFQEIRKVIESARNVLNISLKGYADLTMEEVVQLTGLTSEAAQRAASREYSETLLKGVEPDSEEYYQFLEILDQQDLQCVSGGKFHTVMGKGSNKGKAIQILNQLLCKQYGDIKTVGLGDSANDIPLLEAVDLPFLVQKPTGKWQAIEDTRIQKVDAIGPHGWNLAIYTLLNI